jgi:hypothetical protein
MAGRTRGKLESMDGASLTRAGRVIAQLRRHEFTSSIREIILFDCLLASNQIQVFRSLPEGDPE